MLPLKLEEIPINKFVPKLTYGPLLAINLKQIKIYSNLSFNPFAEPIWRA